MEQYFLQIYKLTNFIELLVIVTQQVGVRNSMFFISLQVKSFYCIDFYCETTAGMILQAYKFTSFQILLIIFVWRHTWCEQVMARFDKLTGLQFFIELGFIVTQQV